MLVGVWVYSRLLHSSPPAAASVSVCLFSFFIVFAIEISPIPSRNESHPTDCMARVVRCERVYNCLKAVDILFLRACSSFFYAINTIVRTDIGPNWTFSFWFLLFFFWQRQDQPHQHRCQLNAVRGQSEQTGLGELHVFDWTKPALQRLRTRSKW